MKQKAAPQIANATIVTSSVFVFIFKAGLTFTKKHVHAEWSLHFWQMKIGGGFCHAEALKMLLLKISNLIGKAASGDLVP
jgi:hypothetical protein